jgi:hypothetical protein
MTGCLGSLLTGTLTAGAGVYGAQNAAEAQEQADTAAIGTQQNYLGNVQSTLNPYTTAGGNAANALSATEGTNGQPANYSGFENMPGFQFSEQMGQQAGERQAAAMGNAGNSGTAAMIGNQVTGTAMQDYNTYVNQLQMTAGMGAGSAATLGNITFGTGTNISQLQQNEGQAAAQGDSSGATAVAGGIGNILGSSGLTGALSGLTGTNSSGVSGSNTGCSIYGTGGANAARSGCGLANGSIGTTYNQSGLSQAPAINDTGIQPITGCTDAMLAGTGCYGF